MEVNDKKLFEGPHSWLKFRAYLLKENRFILTKRWETFGQHLIETSERRQSFLSIGDTLFRARTDIKWVENEIDGSITMHPYGPDEMVPHPSEYTGEGRLNPRGISYLYLASTDKTAIAEVRPWVGAWISVGTYEILKSQKLLNTSKDLRTSFEAMSPFSQDLLQRAEAKSPIYSPEEIEEFIWGDINVAFSEPISPQEQPLGYIPTQYLAEFFKNNGFDGILYKSSLNPSGHNVLLFDADSTSVRMIQGQIYYVRGVDYLSEISGDPDIYSED